MRHPNHRQSTDVYCLLNLRSGGPSSLLLGRRGEKLFFPFSPKKKKRLIAGYCLLSMNEKYEPKVWKVCAKFIWELLSTRERCEKPHTNFTMSDKLTKVSMSISSDSNKPTYSGRPSCVRASERVGYDSSSSSSSSSEVCSNSFGMSLLPFSLKRKGKNLSKSLPCSSLNRPLSVGS